MPVRSIIRSPTRRSPPIRNRLRSKRSACRYPKTAAHFWAACSSATTPTSTKRTLPWLSAVSLRLPARPVQAPSP
ncbi:hypothetical protein BMJ27_32895, partial [Sinorhizobium medicae]